MNVQHKLICGMTKSTAERYLIIRQEIDIMIQRIHKAGYWLSEFDKAEPERMVHTLSMKGVMIVHSISAIQDYLENEFASVEAVGKALNEEKE